MTKKRTTSSVRNPLGTADPVVAAKLTEIIYRARLFNRQARVNIPEEEIISEVVHLWQSVMATLRSAA
jgi:hypothetical protein